MKSLKRVVFATVVVLGLQTFAQDNQNNPYTELLSEDHSALVAYENIIPQNISKKYEAKTKVVSYKFSPDGKYISYTEKDKNGKQHVCVKNIITGEVSKTIAEKEGTIKAYGWLNNEKLTYSIDQVENNKIYSVSLDGSDTKDLTAVKRAKVTVLSLLKEDKEHIIVQMEKKNTQTFEPLN